MSYSFLINYERKLNSFEEKLREIVLNFLKKEEESTTFEINNYLRSHYSEFNSLYERHPIKAWYRSRKILNDLERKGIITKKGITRVKGRFGLNWKWSLNRIKIQKIIGKSKKKS